MSKKRKALKGQSEFVGLLIVLIIVVIILVPLAILLFNYPQQQVTNYHINLAGVASKQVNGGSVLIYYNSTNKPNPYLIVYKGSNFTLAGVYYVYQGKILNVTSQVNATKFTVSGPKYVGKLPQPLIYNFSLPKTVFNDPLILQINAYNVTIFVNVYPNETAYTF